MQLLQKIFLIASAATLLTATSCSQSVTPLPQPQFKHPREMIWKADTLPVPEGAIQVLPEDLLVVSPTDVWLATWVGHGQIMRYDGKTWKMVKEIGGGISSLVRGNVIKSIQQLHTKRSWNFTSRILPANQ